MSGKILAQNLKTLVLGRGSHLGAALTSNLINAKASPFTVDQKEPKKLFNGEQFNRVNVADRSMFEKYLQTTPKIDALVNLAAIRKSYNYYLSYMISRAALEKFRDNDVNEFGCRGVVINLIHLASNYDSKYFAEQDEFAEQYDIDTAKIDEQVFELADQLTANRIRCNTIMVNDQIDPFQFSKLVTHILEDQYIAGQVINMDDNLKHEMPKYDDVIAEIPSFPDDKTPRPDEKYTPPVHKLA